MKLLVVFSNPPIPGEERLRLDKEDRLLASLERMVPGVTVTRAHATEKADVHSLIIDGEYDAIHFSGHGCSNGIYLERGGRQSVPELVSAKNLQALLCLTKKQPLLVTLLCCYSDASIGTLADLAPFVITAFSEVGDSACLHFTEGFYEWFFRGYSVESSFGHARKLVESAGLDPASFHLSRRSLIRNAQSVFVKSRPDPRGDSILVNLDAVADQLDTLPVSRDEVLFLLEKKIAIHGWIFGVPRENAILPVGNLIFGEFRWEDARDVIYCTKLCALAPGLSDEQRKAWYMLLLAYNDLASCQYRLPRHPASPPDVLALGRDSGLFASHFDRYVLPLRPTIERLGYGHLLPSIDFALAELGFAKDQLGADRMPQVIEGMEKALSYLHEVVDALRVPRPKPIPTPGTRARTRAVRGSVTQRRRH